MAELYPRLDNNPNLLPITTTATIHKPGHRRNGSSITVTSIKAVTMKGNVVENLLINLGVRTNTPEETTKRNYRTLLILLFLLILFILSCGGFFLMWFTDIFNDYFISDLVYAPNSTTANLWQNPPVTPQLRVYIFNYTNAEAYLNGTADQMEVQELGPYVYSETVQKVNVTFHPNHTISYKEHRSYKFEGELSSGKIIDRVIVPNVPFFSTISQLQTFNTWLKIAGRTVLSTVEPFKNVSAYDFLWGYEDTLFNWIKTLKTMPFEQFGMLVTRNGTSQESFTIHSGVGNLNRLNVIDSFNGQPKLNFWGTDECNRIDGTDGSQFPPYLMDKKHRLQVFIKAFCRKFPLVFDSEVNVRDGIPAWRYKAPLNVFSHPDENQENQCYCHRNSGQCPPSGVFNATLCFGSPIYSSFPHFLNGAEILFKNIKGLHPDPQKHITYADLHSRFAFPIDGASRFQINVQVSKGGFKSLEHFDEGQILPVIWMEVASGDISKKLRALIYHSTFTLNVMQLSLRYGTLLLCLIFITLFVIICYFKSKPSEEKPEELHVHLHLQNNEIIMKKTNEIETDDN